MKVTSCIHKDPIFNRPTAQFQVCQLVHEHSVLQQQLEYKALRNRLRCVHPKPFPIEPRVEEEFSDPFLQDNEQKIVWQPRYYLTALPLINQQSVKKELESSEEEAPPDPTNISLFLHFKSLLDDLARKGLDFQQIVVTNFQALKMRECGRQKIKVIYKQPQATRRRGVSILRDIGQLELERRNFNEQLIELGTGSELAYFDQILEEKFDRPKGAKRRLRKVFEQLSRLFVRIIQKNV